MIEAFTGNESEKLFKTLGLVQKRKLWLHQVHACTLALSLRFIALFFSPGTGKTLTAISIARIWAKKHKIPFKLLVVSPLVTLENWRQEFLSGSDIPENTITIFRNQKKIPETTKVLITNYESISSKNKFPMIAGFSPMIIIYDESHNLKNPSAKRTKAAFELSLNAPFKMILSGTPILNNPIDIFCQFKAMDNGETLGVNYYVFQRNYFYDANANMPPLKHFPNWKIKPKSLDEIMKKIDKVSVSIKSEDCLDLPPLVVQRLFVELSPEQRKAYEELKKDFVAFISDKACAAPLAIVKLLRLQQILSGFLPVESITGEEDTHVFKENPRISALSELLESLRGTGQIIIWAVFKKDYAQIRKVLENLGLTYRELHGEVSDQDKFKNIQDFTTDRNIDALISNPKSAGIGINLYNAKYCVYFSRTHSLGDDIQSQARNYRAGSEIHEKVTRYDLVAKDTVDELILDRLSKKMEINNDFIEELRIKL